MKRQPNKRHRLLIRWSVPCTVAAMGVAAAAIHLNSRQDPAAPNSDGTVPGLTSVHEQDVTADMLRFEFRDEAAKAGINFRHFPAVRHSLLPEDMGSGAAWGDYDNDGDPDLFLVNFRGTIANATNRTDVTEDNQDQGRCALYRNEGDGRFVDVSDTAGLDVACFGMAAAWGDYDNDNDLDLYITCYGSNRLFRNQGDGTFGDVSIASGANDERFSAGCAWGDYDRDGDIDLYVCNYVHFDYQADERSKTLKFFGAETPHTINPSSYPPVANLLYRNNGDGTFTDVAGDVGVANAEGRSLEAVWFDFDNDGWIDLYVANDVSSNGVFRNQRDGTFADIGASSLAADYRGAMGLAVGDFDHDRDLDLFVTHWVAQENAFFENGVSIGWKDDTGDKRVVFVDAAYQRGLAHVSLQTVGWATGFVDFDNDGQLDLWVVNGNTLQDAEDNTKLKPQKMHIFRQSDSSRFYEVAAPSCPTLSNPFVGRGGAHADFDADGRVDLLVVVHGGKPMLLRNLSHTSGNWLQVRLRQLDANTQALGARVTLQVGDVTHTAQVGADGAYLSQCSTDLHFGIGLPTVIDSLEIQWPDGTSDRHEHVAANQTVEYSHQAQYEANH